MDDEKYFSYDITVERSISELIELRFKYIFQRTKLSLDDFVAERLELSGNRVSADTIAYPGDVITYKHLKSDEKQVEFKYVPLYEDDYIIAIDKPDFMPVIPRMSHHFNSVVVKLKEYLQNEELTPLHRLDIETTGVLIFAKKYEYTSAFHALFRNKEIKKRYEALTYGHFPKNVSEINGCIEKDLDSKIYSKFKLNQQKESNSTTSILHVEHYGSYSKLDLFPVTGKTNQLRIHLAALNHPIIGDKKYYFTEDVYLKWLNDGTESIEQTILKSQALHAKHMSFIHPFTKKVCNINSKSNIMNEYEAVITSHYGSAK